MTLPVSGAPVGLREALQDGADMLEAFVQGHYSEQVANIELYPYLPAAEDVVERLRAALAAQSTPLAEVEAPSLEQEQAAFDEVYQASSQMDHAIMARNCFNAGCIVWANRWPWPENAAQPPATEPAKLTDWAIDKTAGSDILVYKGCSVIEGEQAHQVLAILAAAGVRP